MDKLRAMELFVRVADSGSFTQVADEIDASKSMISKEISKLEASVGARLLQRSTRNLQLTEIGQHYLEKCRDILSRIEHAESNIQDAQQTPRGKLKINAPMALGLYGLDEMFSQFMHQYPEIELDIQLGDENIDLIKEGFDIGFRVTSKLADTNYIGKALSKFKYKICTSQQYLDKAGAITQAQQLSNHNCFVYSYFVGRNVWPIAGGIEVKGSLRVNSTPFMKQSIIDGHGVAFLPDFLCKKELATGEIIEILEDVPKPELTMYALYPARKYVQPKLTACMAFMQEWFKD